MLVVFSASEKTENLLTLPGIEPKFVSGQSRSLVTILVKICDSHNRLTSHLKVYMFANHLGQKLMIKLGGDEFKKPLGSMCHYICLLYKIPKDYAG